MQPQCRKNPAVFRACMRPAPGRLVARGRPAVVTKVPTPASDANFGQNWYRLED